MSLGLGVMGAGGAVKVSVLAMCMTGGLGTNLTHAGQPGGPWLGSAGAAGSSGCLREHLRKSEARPRRNRSVLHGR